MISFRPCITADYPAVCQLMRSPEELFKVWPKGQYPLTVEKLEQLASERFGLTVAETDDHLIGFANLYRHLGHTFIGNVIIANEQRGHGFGRQLIHHMEEIAARESGLGELHISVFTDNTPAVLLYHSLGYLPYALEERLDPQQHRWVLLHMKKVLS